MTYIQAKIQNHPNYPQFTNHVGTITKGCVEVVQEYGIEKHNELNLRVVVVCSIRVVGATAKSRKKAAIKLLKGVNFWIRRFPVEWLIKDSNFKVLTPDGFAEYQTKKNRGTEMKKQYFIFWFFVFLILAVFGMSMGIVGWILSASKISIVSFLLGSVISFIALIRHIFQYKKQLGLPKFENPPAPPENNNGIRCPNCYAINNGDYEFCQICGRRLQVIEKPNLNPYGIVDGFRIDIVPSCHQQKGSAVLIVNPEDYEQIKTQNKTEEQK